MLQGGLQADHVYGRRSYLRLDCAGTPPQFRGKALVVKGFTRKVLEVLEGRERLIQHSGKGRAASRILVDPDGVRHRVPSHQLHFEGLALMNKVETEHYFNQLLYASFPDMAVIPVGVVEYLSPRLRDGDRTTGAVLMVIDDIKDLRVAHLANRLASPGGTEGVENPEGRLAIARLRELIHASASGLGTIHRLGMIHRYFHLGNAGVGGAGVRVKDLETVYGSRQLTKKQFIEWALADVEYFLTNIRSAFFYKDDLVTLVLGNAWERDILASYLAGGAARPAGETAELRQKGATPMLREHLLRISGGLSFGVGVPIVRQKEGILLSELLSNPLPGHFVVPDPAIPYVKNHAGLGEQDKDIANGDYAGIVNRFNSGARVLPSEPRDIYNLVIALLVKKEDDMAQKIFREKRAEIALVEESIRSARIGHAERQLGRGAP
ncbi:MAG: hypothetical protein A2089_12640 [Elusimicrobia bacterium GWD2_63_28]|nr:MAG: hypothetical protein A2089_12640 [Elusimicrobia bacterium GWD2_63_28]